MPNLLGKIPWIMRLLGRGMNADIRPDRMEDGLHRYAENMRMGSVTGDSGTLESIGGQVVLHPPEPDEVDLNASYVCIGAVMAGNDLFSVHASAAEGLFPRVKINGVTMALSAAIPYTWDRPLQLKVIDRKQGPIVFPVDGNAPALFWDVEAIKAAYDAGEETYFSQLEIQAISVVPAGPTEWPQHMGNPNIGVGAKPGQYVFWLRLYDKDGNRSNPGPMTPMISVPMFQSQIYPPGLQQYPGGQMAGSEPAPEGTSSPYGVALKWQIDNRYGLAGWELIVSEFNDGQGLSGPGVTKVVARNPMSANEFGYIDFVYPRDNNFDETVPADEAQQQFVNFTAPKAVELIDNKVIYGNITLRDEVVQLEFRSVDGNKTFPFTKRVFTRHYGQPYNDGFADPVNNTYSKAALHNERYGVGVMLWDGNASRSAVVSVDGNVLFPERARRKTGDSEKYSTDPIYRTNTECQGNDPVSPTFDAIVQGTTSKTDSQYVNVMNGLNYNPWRPQGPDSENAVRYKQKPVAAWTTNTGVTQSDTGAVFGPQIHAMGCGIYGPTNLDEQAPWCEVISVMRTPPAKRVIASGMGVYKMRGGPPPLSSQKSTNELTCYFPDIDSGLVDANIVSDMTQNPGQYTVKLTPYGFYSEVYGYRASGLWATADQSVEFMDIISYMDMQNDPGNGVVGGVNVGEPAGAMAVQPISSAPPSRTNNIGYPAWRRLSGDIPAPSAGNELVFMDTNNADQGAVEIPMTEFIRFQEGRGFLCGIQLDLPIYRPSEVIAGTQFEQQATRRFHGPVWIVDIIRSQAQVPVSNVQQYLNTGTHIATERTIAIFQPDADPMTRVELFHARPYDAIPRVQQVDIRYAYVQEEGQPERRWMHGANFTNGVPLTTIAADIVNNGFWVDAEGNQVYGVYGADFDTSGVHPVWYLTFESHLGLPVPPTGARIVVKYDNREPILSHGFDGSVNPTVFAPFDRLSSTAFPCTAPMPYSGGIRSSLYVLPRQPTNPPAAYEPDVFAISSGISPPYVTTGMRQWIVMGTVVTRTPQYMNRGGDDYERYSFPRYHYIIRPSIPVSYVSGVANGFNTLYDQEYPDEAQVFDYGGFRFRGLYNLDYSKQPNVTGTGIPLNGQNPRTMLPTGMVASLTYNPLSQDSPGLRTFTFDNLFIADEAMGELKMMQALDQGGRQALWGWTQKGYFNVPYNAQMLTDAEGNTIATQSVGTFWPRRENWIARDDHGMPDEFWRMAIKANVPMGSQNMDTVIWVDRTSVYMLAGALASDIAVNKIRSVLLPTLSATPGDGRPGYSAVYNRKNEELWITMLVNSPSESSRLSPVMYVFDMARKEWVGVFSYVHEQYVSRNDRVLASTGLTIYEVNIGDKINGRPITSTFTVPFFMEYQLRKEAMRWRVVGDMPANFLSNPDYAPFLPSSVEVLDAQGNVLSLMDGDQYALWAKNYDGFEGWVNRVLESINTNRPLPQSQGFFLRVSYNTFGRKVVASVGMQLKTIK
jgi:hypothetical protein